MTAILVTTGLVFVAVVLAVIGLVLDRDGATARALGKRLMGLTRGGAEESPADVQRDDRYSSVPALDRLLKALAVGRNVELVLCQAGMTMRPGLLIIVMASFGMAGYFVGALFLHKLLLGLLLLVTCGWLPYLYVLYRKHVRMKAFAREFPDAIDLLVSALRAGLSFTAAMQIVSEESPEPVRSEFAVTVGEQALGVEFREALTHLTERVDSLDLRFFVTAVLLQRDTGGNLAEILSNTAALIRDRFRVLGDIATFTAQGRLTGGILACLPIGMGLFMFASAPDYFKPMLEAPQGRTALLVAGSMQLLGVLVIRQIVRIKV